MLVVVSAGDDANVPTKGILNPKPSCIRASSADRSLAALQDSKTVDNKCVECPALLNTRGGQSEVAPAVPVTSWVVKSLETTIHAHLKE
jgi:hypothetical protein